LTPTRHIPWEPVWRVEGEFRREFLREVGLTTVSEAVGALGSLWYHLTKGVVKLCVVNEGDPTRGRWSEHPLWTAIANVEWRTPVSELQRRVRPVAAPSNTYLARHMRALVTSKMARDGDATPGEAARSLLALMRDLLEHESLFKGVSAENALSGLVAAKARKFFSRRNVGPGTPEPPPTDEAVRAYREASRGR